MSDDDLRILIVDDSALFRQSVSMVLAEIPGVKIVGTAKDGQEAVLKAQELEPDLLTLDVEMPVMNGIDTLREIRRLRLKTRAIMLSSLTEAGAKVTLDALFEGAFDFITKPTGGIFQSRDKLRASLAEKIEAFRVHRQTRRALSATAAVRPLMISEPLSSDQSKPNYDSCEIVVIGLSTGGPQTLRMVLPRIDPDFPVPIVIVQHMPANYTQSMAQRLDEVCSLSISQAADGDIVRAGSVYIAPGGRHLEMRRHAGSVQLKVSDSEPENSCRPSVDFTLRSAIPIYQSHLLAVILTGMGKDGLHGCQAVKKAGGHVFAQDEETSAVYGMPKAVIDAGIVDRILSVGKIAPAIVRHVHRSRLS